jgi:hypothetical protein
VSLYISLSTFVEIPVTTENIKNIWGRTPARWKRQFFCSSVPGDRSEEALLD